MHGQQSRRSERQRQCAILRAFVLHAAAAFERLSPARAFDKNAAHRFRRGRKELRAPCPASLLFSGQAQPGFMNQRGGLESLAGALARHLVRGQLAQFLINEREQFLGGLGIALLERVRGCG